MRRARIVPWTGLLLLLSLPAFGGSYEETNVGDGGTVKGVVKLAGKAPKLPPLQVTKFKEVCRDVPDESLIVGPARGVRHAVLTLEGITRGKPVEREVLHELDNSRCRFVPHVLVASVGQFLLLKNTDPILHTAHAYFHAGQPHFNVGLHPGRVSRKPLVAPGIFKVLCEVHPWMVAHLVVTDHPYHAVTDVYGEYELRDVPPGAYRLKLWHERLGAHERPVEVRAGATTRADFALRLPTGVKK